MLALTLVGLSFLVVLTIPIFLVVGETAGQIVLGFFIPLIIAIVLQIMALMIS